MELYTRDRRLVMIITLLTLIVGLTESQNQIVSYGLSESLYKKLKNSELDDVPPPGNNSVTEVSVDLFLRSVSNVNPATMDYWVDVYLTQSWVDDRLHESGAEDQFISLPNSFIQKLWTPDLFFTKAKQGKIHSVTNPNMVLKLNPSNGSLLFSQRIRAQLGCTMDLSYFPFDSQDCQIIMESWRYGDDLLKLKWKEGSYETLDNAVVDKKLSRNLPSLGIDTKYDNGTCARIDSNRGNFSCLRYYITFYRSLPFYIWDIYVPSTLMVIVTWMTFWIDRKIIQGRCALGSLTMVAISNQINSVKSVLPPTAQTKAADVWLWACQFYVLLAFLEFGLVNWLNRRDEAKKRIQEAAEEKARQEEEERLNIRAESEAVEMRRGPSEEELTQDEIEFRILSQYQSRGAASTDSEEESDSESEYEEEIIEEVVADPDPDYKTISILSSAEHRMFRESNLSRTNSVSFAEATNNQEKQADSNLRAPSRVNGSLRSQTKKLSAIDDTEDDGEEETSLGVTEEPTDVTMESEEAKVTDCVAVLRRPNETTDGAHDNTAFIAALTGPGAIEMDRMHPAGSVIRRTIRKSKMPQTKVQIIKRDARKRWNRFCKTGRAKRIDIISRGLFPGSFFILAIIYWAYYLTISDYYEYENRDT